MLTFRSKGWNLYEAREAVTYADKELRQAQERLKELPEQSAQAQTIEEIKALHAEAEELRDFVEAVNQFRAKWQPLAADLESTGSINLKPVGADIALRSFSADHVNFDDRGLNKMDYTNDLETRSLQKFVSGGMKSLGEEEKRALDISGSAAVLPVKIADQLIKNEKYSDLLYRATVINESGAGTVRIPIASDTAASWKVENTELIEAATYEAAPTLTYIDLKGYELARLMTVSAAVVSMATDNFVGHMLDLLSAEVVETLEASFVNGTGTGQPKGLSKLTYTTGTNQILTASAATPIAPVNMAAALALMPQKYARNAVIVCNSDTLYNLISLFKGTSEFAFSLADGATRFLGKEIIVNEHVADDELYILDPKQLYVRFAMPIMLEADRSSSFRSASVDLRALTICDAAYNTKAVVRVGLGS